MAFVWPCIPWASARLLAGLCGGLSGCLLGGLLLGVRFLVKPAEHLVEHIAKAIATLLRCGFLKASIAADILGFFGFPSLSSLSDLGRC